MAALDCISRQLSTTCLNDYERIQYSEEELVAMRAVKAELISRGLDEAKIGLRALAVTTINSKLRIQEAADKHMKWLEGLRNFGIDCVDENIWKDEASRMLRSYAPSGVDSKGRSIFWIKGGVIQIEEEKLSMFAGVMYFMAIHGDNVSLREGISFIIDVRNSDNKVGNEKRLQSSYQAFPLRPQRILIFGAGKVKRVFINGLITVASFFTKKKILDRIRFVSIEDVLAEVPNASVPVYVGGQGGGIQDLAVWVKQRLDAFPVPAL